KTPESLGGAPPPPGPPWGHFTGRKPRKVPAQGLVGPGFPGWLNTRAPKVRGMEIIDELEPQRRNAWCGSIGYLSFCGNLDTSLTIRTLPALNGQIFCFAGVGIVTSSL
ncbi:chorismate-binding protein, partial [Escherichia coli]|nr:chorismate-binding protein [Escherichia coli]